MAMDRLTNAFRESVDRMTNQMIEEGYKMPKIIVMKREIGQALDEIIMNLIRTLPNNVKTPKDENTLLVADACATMESLLDEVKSFKKYIDDETGKEE